MKYIWLTEEFGLEGFSVMNVEETLFTLINEKSVFCGDMLGKEWRMK